MNCLCGHTLDEHCGTHGCHECPCFRFRLTNVIADEQDFDRMVAEALALLAAQPKGKVQ
jgi:hypothetical protein